MASVLNLPSPLIAQGRWDISKSTIERAPTYFCDMPFFRMILRSNDFERKTILSPFKVEMRDKHNVITGRLRKCVKRGQLDPFQP